MIIRRKNNIIKMIKSSLKFYNSFLEAIVKLSIYLIFPSVHRKIKLANKYQLGIILNYASFRFFQKNHR